MDEAMDYDAMVPGPFRQRSDPAAEPEDAVAEIMDEVMDGDCPERHVTNGPTTAREPTQPQVTKAQ